MWLHAQSHVVQWKTNTGFFTGIEFCFYKQPRDGSSLRNSWWRLEEYGPVGRRVREWVYITGQKTISPLVETCTGGSCLPGRDQKRVRSMLLETRRQRPLLVMAGSLMSLFPAGMWKAETVSSHVYLVTPLCCRCCLVSSLFDHKMWEEGRKGGPWWQTIRFKQTGFGDSFGCVCVCAHKFSFFFFIGGGLFYKLVLGLMALNSLSFFRCQNMLKIGWLEILAWGQS